MKHFLLVGLISILSLGISSCGENKTKEMADNAVKYPLDNKEDRRLKRGSVFGEEGLTLFGGGSKKKTADYDNITGGVNAYLWRASLDVISFMPLSSADAIGGIIITNWYEGSSNRGERIKANINITSKDLRASGVKVSLFRQKYRGGRWKDSAKNKKLERQLEDKILARAREIKISDKRR